MQEWADDMWNAAAEAHRRDDELAKRTPHVYKLDMVNHRNGGAPRCNVCASTHDDPIHVRHMRDCKNRYGMGTTACPACVLDAQAIIATGCTTNPYAATCGHAMDNRPSCTLCGRQQSTD